MLTIQSLDTFLKGVESYLPYLQASGELHDPVFDEPTQYGTAYYALCNAILASLPHAPSRPAYLERALRGLRAALHHVAAVESPSTAAQFRRDTGQIERLNHRDFFWPPVLKTYILLGRAGVPNMEPLARQIEQIDIESAFTSRPPKNWASVWMLGEWMRRQIGLSPYSLHDFDRWLGEFFQSRILLPQGLYQEPGHPNSYDLFTRYHLAELLINGYQGCWQTELEQLLRTGIERSLALQLSDGSLASAYRSTGQTWTLGVQCAYFTQAARYFRSIDQDLAEECVQAARRSLHSFCRWQRDCGPYSPVENCLPPEYRVGYENYTADGHYGPLALAFLGTAILNGLRDDAGTEMLGRSASVFIEHAPTYRAIIHHGQVSLHINAFPSPEYDAFGIVDLTFGPDRFLHFVSSVRHQETRRLFNLGMAMRDEPGRSELVLLSQQNLALIGEMQSGPERASLCLHAQPRGRPHTYRLRAQVDLSGASITETTPGFSNFKTLLVPYLRDLGKGETTHISCEARRIVLKHRSEQIAIVMNADIEHIIDLPYGYENRRGLCGLLRVDFADLSEEISYQIKMIA